MRDARPLLSLLALAQAVHGQSILPYNPTRIFLHPNSTYAYVFGPSAQSSAQAQLSALDVTKSFDSGKAQLLPVTTALPFLHDGGHLPYTPMIDASGNITVISGKCTAGSRDAQVWQFEPDKAGASAQGTWTRYKALYEESGRDADYPGPGYLSNGITFSDRIDGDTADSNIYVFGGMCPFENSTASTWISAADYSNSMLTITPDGSEYDISSVDDRTLPISQAGSSITPLPATYGLNASGAVQSQQQDFVLLGGNTQTAFINMSQVALFSLPQQSWSFLDVLQPSGGKTDLTIKRAAKEVTPRSGHTAVLSESGSSIIVFGGWVGDVNTPAEPQLAVLDIGADYGGTGDWKWTIPEQTGDGLATGAGIYGHGATMLPGGIMMVLGGYQISASTSSSSKMARRAAQPANTRTFLYNTTSQSWLKSYDPPLAPKDQSSGGSGPLSSTSEKVGLATGLGVGAALLVTVVGFYVWYGRRLKKTRDDRERALLAYSSDGSMTGHMDQPFLPSGMDGRGANEVAMAAYWSNHEMSENPSYPRPPPMQHATGAFVNVPSPTRGLRKGSVGKNYSYQPAPRYDDKRLSRGSGNIHPIAEDENEDDHKYLADGQTQGVLADAEMRLREVERVLNSSDPFQDPEPRPLSSHPVALAAFETVRRVPTGASQMPSPSRRPVSRGDEDAANWTVENDGKDMVLEEQDAGFSWVNGDDRTSSSLSERSQRSALSSNGTITRTMSTKTGQLMAAAGLAAAAKSTAASPQPSPTRERSNTVSTIESARATPNFRSRVRSPTGDSLVPPLTPGGEDGASFKSARSNLLHLQHESEALMHGPQAFSSVDDPYQRAVAAHHSTRGRPQSAFLGMGSAGAPPIPPRRRPGLMGSLRRALHALPIGDRSFSLTGTSAEQYDDVFRTSSSSPTKEPLTPTSAAFNRASKAPRRAMSDGSALLRHLRGQKDWDATIWPPYRDDPNADDWGEPKPGTLPRSSEERRQAEADWDVEGAAGERDFQVLFSVPKSRLRVVNDDMDRESLRSASVSDAGGVGSRGGSLRREGSVVRPLRGGGRKDGLSGGGGEREWDRGGGFLAATSEEEEGEREKVKDA